MCDCSSPGKVVQKVKYLIAVVSIEHDTDTERMREKVCSYLLRESPNVCKIRLE